MYIRYLLAGLLIFTACKTPQPTSAVSFSATGPAWGALWQQRAAEYKALCLQAYQVAAQRVEVMSHQQTLRPRAIVTDIDETILDNSPFSAKNALAGKPYSQQAWEEWTALAAADTVPGALSFFKDAAAKGFTIYYITNRLEKERAATLKNLQRWGFPFADNDHLILSDGNSNKEPRRAVVARKFEIAMLVGDNLGDFAEVFYRKSPAERSAAVDQLRDEFGGRFIVLPNVMYGDWLSALAPRGLTPQQTDSVLKKQVREF
ncbi:5'-nucleotidase, lipoprotein e(P4) family [Chitinophaga lutea]|uniref:5'-nucleotidase, lipoprotein e(P4) family n=1 Tax=Chitinophaga lutea TaxID=2488634 RepID=A0A3N4Q0S0_9BACT|nr:5'-nucleotidase, lipoprotein e(P4) family [Chitinophaga lutea]RPE09837.1 5'-nucleotidase, lipoprotein e(P4) family [Chitinophaga lutea]